MGQVALGLRSLVVKLVLFVAFAALLAWALGGTLWPRPTVVNYPAIDFAGQAWSLQLAVSGEPKQARWSLIRREGEKPAIELGDWAEATGPLLIDDRLIVAGRPAGGAEWTVYRFSASGEPVQEQLPDRLAVEERLAELRGAS